MYGTDRSWGEAGAQDVEAVKNEITFQNLINVASNETLFKALDEETQKELATLVSIYTKVCIAAIKYNPASSDKEISEGIKVKKLNKE